MTQKSAISIAVLSRTQDDVQQIDSTLRRAGHPTRCLWVQTPGRFADTLQKETLELIVINVEQYPDPIRQVVNEKEPFFPEVPVIAIAGSINEADILKSMQSGACDLVSTRQPARLLAVVIRELRSCRVERALNATLSSANQYRRQLKDYMQNSPTAIAYVQEGIVTDTNSAWLKMFRAGDGSEVVGLPLMDSFHSESHAAVKGALIAASRGKWQAGEVLRRIQAEVAPGWSAQQQAAANAIVMDVCEVREQAVVKEIEQATQQAREEEKALAESWWQENADKDGNKRLKRKSH